MICSGSFSGTTNAAYCFIAIGACWYAFSIKIIFRLRVCTACCSGNAHRPTGRSDGCRRTCHVHPIRRGTCGVGCACVGDRQTFGTSHFIHPSVDGHVVGPVQIDQGRRQIACDAQSRRGGIDGDAGITRRTASTRVEHGRPHFRGAGIDLDRNDPSVRSGIDGVKSPLQGGE